MKKRGLFGLSLLLLLVAGCGPQTIPPAHVGVLFDGSHGYRKKLLTSQVVWVGLYQDLVLYPTSTHQATYVRNAREGEKGDTSIQASTIEGALLPTDVTVAFHVEPDHVLTAFNEFGTADMETIERDYVRGATIAAVNIVSGRHSIFELLSKDRAKFGPEVLVELKGDLLDWGLTVDNVYIGEVHPSEEINAKIQESLGRQNDLAQKDVEVKTAEADARTTIINSEKVAAQNQQLAGQGTKALSLYHLETRNLAIERWKAAGGHPPLQGDGRVPFTSSSVMP